MSDSINNAYLTFVLGGVTYAVDVCTVREILSYETITRVPRTAPYLKGVMNIRGTVISVIDLRDLLNIEAANDIEDASIIVAEIQIPGEQEMVCGFIADDVESVIALESVTGTADDSAMEMMHNEFISQVGHSGERFVLILDMLKIIRHVEEDLDTQKIV